MGRIKQLDTLTANMIAAGEVVERPMGVVKELVENAIDAGSTRIEVNITEGGIQRLSVIDNGCGMDAQDAQLCFGRHATSKIQSQNDLWSIHTLGFRGEALPSISSVSRMVLSTSDGKDATRVVVAYGNVESVTPYPCNQGTEVSVEGLFYQTPARLKHMRSAAYEASLIQDVVSKFALSHPEIAFILRSDDRESFRTSGQGNLLEVIYQVFGRMAAEAGNGVTPEQLIEKKLAEMEAKDENLKNLVKEYHDGLLLIEMSTRTVWDKAASDEAGLQTFFNKHRKNYAWKEPRFKGIAYHVQNPADVKAVKDCVAKIPFKAWGEKLRTTFNNDSTIRIRVEKGIFKKGDNALVDRDIFKEKVEVKPMKDYPIDAVYGKKLKAPEDLDDVRSLVISDYQEELEKEWVKSLRQKYSVVVNPEVLATVNKH